MSEELRETNTNTGEISDITEKEIQSVELGEQKREVVKTPALKRSRGKILRELVDYGDYKAFEAVREFEVRGRRVQVVSYRIILTDNLLDEMHKHKLLDSKDDSNPEKIQTALRPILAKIADSNYNFEPGYINIEGTSENGQMKAQMLNVEAPIPFKDAKDLVNNLYGPEGASLELALKARGGKRSEYEVRSEFASTADYEDFNKHYQNINVRSLAVANKLREEGKDFLYDYVEAKKYLVNIQDEEDGDVKKEQAEELVQSFEDIVLHGGVPNYRDLVLYAAVLKQVENYIPPERKSREELLLAKILNNVANYSWQKVRQEAQGLTKEAFFKLCDSLLVAAGVAESYDYVKEKVFAPEGVVPKNLKGNRIIRTKQGGEWVDLVMETAWDFLQKRHSEKNYFSPPGRVKQGQIVKSFDNALKGAPSYEQPSIITDSTGRVYFKFYLKHPTKDEKFRRYLPLSSGTKGLTETPENNEQAIQIVSTADRIFSGDKNLKSLNARTEIIGGADEDPEIKFVLGGDRVMKFSEVLERFDFGRRLTAKVCLDEFVNRKKAEKEFASAEEKDKSWANLTQDQRNKIIRLTTLLSQGGSPSVSEEMITEFVNRSLAVAESTGTLKSMGARKVKALGDVFRKDSVEEAPKPSSSETLFREKIKPGQRDFQIIRDLVYLAPKETGDFVSEEQLLEAINERAREERVEPEALIFRLCEAFERLYMGKKRLFAKGITNTAERKRYLKRNSLTPNEKLLVWVSTLRNELSESAKSVIETELPSDEALSFVDKFAKTREKLMSSDLQLQCARSYDNMRNPNMPVDEFHRFFENFWTAWAEKHVSAMTVNRQIGSGEISKP